MFHARMTWQQIGTCPTCGGAMDPAQATYNKDGVLQCRVCAAKTTIAEGDARAVSSTVGSAVGILIGGLLSMTCFNPFLIVSVITVASAIGWLLMVARNPGHRANMGGKFAPCVIAVVIGLALGTLPLVLVAFGMTAAMLTR